jgi:hypothetical protein
VQKIVAHAPINGEFRAHFLGLEEAEKRKEFFFSGENGSFYKPFQTEPYEPLSFL